MKVRYGSIVLKKSTSNNFEDFLEDVSVQPSAVCSIEAVLTSRVIALLRSCGKRSEFFNGIGRQQPVVIVRDFSISATCYPDVKGPVRPRADVFTSPV